ncbi:winged helix-turn-helix domain-containing protein [Methylorubrum sp. SL192]|uniref:winged helix-turn-helix domain-containing protein n=1 Tax=Methylorubrum sp. SL192 TaxID=2995167 RepID=UPI0022743904|nr:winged helix-turn-helix domain-containing protein [Methylorubrum sp. SL192]MCY1643568.1 winged helix-turn-helix domain-containing protein [Methylorubrum sp. SL192]
MVLSEAEALARLEALRRQRDAIERQIADLLLYLDLGRRLGGPAAPAQPSPDARADAPIPVQEPTLQPAQAPVAAPPAPPAAAPERPPVPAFAVPVEGEVGLSETVLARRYGRALIEAVLAVLEEAGRPMHASEILARISEQGFSLPGQDPVAALNTRLWKRSGPGGPLKRLGEAVYAPADAEEG